MGPVAHLKTLILVGIERIIQPFGETGELKTSKDCRRLETIGDLVPLFSMLSEHTRHSYLNFPSMSALPCV